MLLIEQPDKYVRVLMLSLSLKSIYRSKCQTQGGRFDGDELICIQISLILMIGFLLVSISVILAADPNIFIREIWVRKELKEEREQSEMKASDKSFQDPSSNCLIQLCKQVSDQLARQSIGDSHWKHKENIFSIILRSFQQDSLPDSAFDWSSVHN